MKKRLKSFFKTEQRGSSVKTELLAGITIFLTMVYILPVNASMMSELPGVSYGAVYIGTALTTVIASAVTGLLSNLPMAQSVALGTNAYFIYSVCLGMGFSYENALFITLLEGLIFVILSVTGIRRRILQAVPDSVPTAITIGIALFLAIQGLRNAGILIADPDNLASVTSYNLLSSFPEEAIVSIAVFLLSVLLLLFLERKNVKGAAFFSIIAGTAFYYLIGVFRPGFYETAFAGISMDPVSSFGEFFSGSFLKCFTEGLDFSGYLSVSGNSSVSLVVSLVFTTFAFCMLDMFSAIGTLTAVLEGSLGKAKSGRNPSEVKGNRNPSGADGKRIPSGAEVKRNPSGADDKVYAASLNRAMLSDAIGTCTGGLLGVSSVTTYLESVSGVRAGGKTGLTSLTVSALFLLASFLTPVSALIPSCAYAGVLFYVGAVMVKECVSELKSGENFPVSPLIMILVIALTCNIAYGFALGMIFEVLTALVSGKGKTIGRSMWILFVCSLMLLLFTH